MRNLFPIAVIGKNNVFRTGCCPLHNNDKEYDDYFKNLTYGTWMIMDSSTFTDLPGKIHPYPCRKLCVIGDIEIDPKATTIKSAASLEAAMNLIGENLKITIITNSALFTELLNTYVDRIACITIATIDQDFEGNDLFPGIPPFHWQPRTIKIKQSKKKFVGYSILRYKLDINEI